MQIASETIKKHTEDRPWGRFECFAVNQKCTVKLIHIEPNARLSLQYHLGRTEFWRVVSGDAIAVINRKIVPLLLNDEITVPLGEHHRLVGGKNGATVLEIAFGDFDERDIIRVDDDYSRK